MAPLLDRNRGSEDGLTEDSRRIKNASRGQGLVEASIHLLNVACQWNDGATSALLAT
jgi:hypothetical protein